VQKIIFWGIMSAIGWYGLRSFKKTAEQAHQNSLRTNKENETDAIGTLVRDEKTGDYVVKRN
jgi:hypothetical protein